MKANSSNHRQTTKCQELYKETYGSILKHHTWAFLEILDFAASPPFVSSFTQRA